MTTTTDWPAGWTARERVETVALDRDAADDPAEIADEAGVDVATARAVLAGLAEDYSDTRWVDDE
ncbi:hypothetical protein BDK61_1465 [Haloarcula quadrata]|uniref:Homeodomain-like domain-containing protein n=1 Tax=Haloarcula quadrata TaxID=182779 RepID=A0A495R529_9EURY|nr:hypothetical protein [Haloarcula quadrata]RKS82166.1 hypothetical protein BDK61_1465 [Haloarcula quadrata]